MPSLARKALTFVLLLTPFAALAAQAETFEWQGEAAPIAVLRVDIVRGDLVVRPASGDRIAVSAIQRGRDAGVRPVEIEVEEGLSEVTIRTVYPRRKSRDEPESKVRVDFRVSLPPGVRFIGRTGVGDIEALRLSDPVQAFSQVGDIRISSASYAEAQTTNGSIFASLGRTDWGGTLSFRTTNGNIEVQIPGSADVEISAKSTNGRFDTDLFPVEHERHGIPGARVRGKLGDGGRRLELATVNGGLKLTRQDG